MTDRHVISQPEGEDPETAGLRVERNRPHPAKGDIQIRNFFSSGYTDTAVHVDDDEVEELIEALEEVTE